MDYMNKALQSPIGTIGVFKPQEEERAWAQYVDKYCTIKDATFWSKAEGNGGELEVEFMEDGVVLTIGIDEFKVV